MKIPWNLVLLCASLTVGVGLFEVVVRATGKEYELTPNWKYHPVLGWSQVPNGRYDFTLGGRPVHVSFNSMGFRDRERQRAKPPGTASACTDSAAPARAPEVRMPELVSWGSSTLQPGGASAGLATVPVRATLPSGGKLSRMAATAHCDVTSFGGSAYHAG